MPLLEKKCIPCEGSTSPLKQEEVQKLLKEIPSWEIKDGNVFRQFKFKNFKEAIAFVNKVAEIAEKEGHHPDITINYNKVSIDIFTHSINGISENDFILAAKISKIVE